MNFNNVARMNRAGTFNISTNHLLSQSYLDLSTLDLEEATVNQGVLDVFPSIDATINGHYELETETDQYAYLTVPDENQVDRAIFIGIIPASNVTFKPAEDVTRLMGFGLGYYQTQQPVPELFTHNTATKNPALTIRGLIGADEWAGMGGIEPYRIMPVTAWGSTLGTRVFDFGRTDKIKYAIDKISDYTRHVYQVRSAISSGNPVSRAYFVHEDDIDTYMDLPADLSIDNPSHYCEDEIRMEWKADESFNQFIVVGRDSSGTTFSGCYMTPSATQGDVPIKAYIENSGAWTTQSQVTARALELGTLYGVAASVYSATLSEMMGVSLLQRIRFRYFTGISDAWQRITNVRYHIKADAESKVEIQFTSDAKFSNMRRMYRSMLPDPVSEMQAIFNDSMSQVPGNDVGTVTTLNGDGTALITLEDGRQVTARVF